MSEALVRCPVCQRVMAVTEEPGVKVSVKCAACRQWRTATAVLRLEPVG